MTSEILGRNCARSSGPHGGPFCVGEHQPTLRERMRPTMSCPGQAGRRLRVSRHRRRTVPCGLRSLEGRATASNEWGRQGLLTQWYWCSGSRTNHHRNIRPRQIRHGMVVESPKARSSSHPEEPEKSVSIACLSWQPIMRHLVSQFNVRTSALLRPFA